MEETGLIVCDTDIIIEFLDRGNTTVKKKLEIFGFDNVCLSAITASELVYGATDKKHYNRLVEFISRSIVISLNKEISGLHFELVKKYSLSHKLGVQDALIAATALTFELPLFTGNKKDFMFIEKINLVS